MPLAHRLTLASALCAALCAVLCASPALAQVPSRGSSPERRAARHVVYLEAGGPGLLYSLNYEREVLPGLSVRVGASLFALMETGTRDTLGVFTVPLTAQYLVGRGSHHLELGLGLVTGVLWSDLNSYQPTPPLGLILATATVGYRYQRPQGGPVVRVAFTPWFGGERFSPLGLPVMPWGGVSVGWAF